MSSLYGFSTHCSTPVDAHVVGGDLLKLIICRFRNRHSDNHNKGIISVRF